METTLNNQFNNLSISELDLINTGVIGGVTTVIQGWNAD